MKHEYFIRSSTSNDELALCELLELVFNQQRSIKEWQWKFVASRNLLINPNSGAESLIIINQHGLIVGHAGAVTVPGWLHGSQIPIVQICDVMIHPQHRGGWGRHNLFTILLRELLTKISIKLPTAFRYGFPGRRPYLLGERAQVYEQIEIAAENIIIPAKQKLSALKITQINWDDPCLDSIWSNLRNQYKLSVIRDGAYLRWRYASHPTRSYNLIAITLLNQMIGWIVSYTDEKRWLLVDVLLPRALLRIAITTVVAELAALKINLNHYAQIWLSPAWRIKLAGQIQTTPVFTANMSWLSSVDTQTAQTFLYYTMGDVDIF